MKERATKVIEQDDNKKRATRVIDQKTDKADRKTAVVLEKDLRQNRKTTVTNEDKQYSRSTICIGEDNEIIDVDDVLGDAIDDEYSFDRVLSVKSGQSVVYTAKKKGENNVYVCKLYRSQATVIDPKVVEILANKIKSSYVIKIVKYGYYKNRFYTITPYYEEGSVIEHIEEIETDILKKKYINQLNEALNTIHNAGIFHCDIKPHNIYFNKDRSELVIGDFGIALHIDKFQTIKTPYGEAIAKRDLQKNNATIAYLSQEGDEYATREVDYFALGMSILNMAHKGDVYANVEDNVVRDKVMLEGIRIPDDVEPEIAALVSKMLDADPKKRIGYEGVKKWCKNTGVYGKKHSANKNSECVVEIEMAVFNGNTYTSTEEYTNAIASGGKTATSYYERDGILNDIARAGADQNIIKELSNIKAKNNLEEGLYLTLIYLNPNIPFNIGNNAFGNIKGYIQYLDDNLTKKRVYYNSDIIQQELKNEIRTKRIKNDPELLDIIDTIVGTKFDPQEQATLLRNFLTKKETIIIDKKELQLNELAEQMFDAYIEPIDNKIIFSDAFLKMLCFRYQNLKDNEEKLKSIYKIKDSFSRNAQFAIYLSNSIPTTIDKKTINNPYDIVTYAKELYENNLPSDNFCILLRNGTIAKYCNEFSDDNNNLVELIKEIENRKYNNNDALTYFYNFTQEHKSFMLNDKKIDSLADLFKLLSVKATLCSLSEELVRSTSFKIWLESNGYSRCVSILTKTCSEGYDYTYVSFLNGGKR